jgi:hypothetical protein
MSRFQVPTRSLSLSGPDSESLAPGRLPGLPRPGRPGVRATVTVAALRLAHRARLAAARPAGGHGHGLSLSDSGSAASGRHSGPRPRAAAAGRQLPGQRPPGPGPRTAAGCPPGCHYPALPRPASQCLAAGGRSGRQARACRRRANLNRAPSPRAARTPARRRDSDRTVRSDSLARAASDSAGSRIM